MLVYARPATLGFCGSSGKSGSINTKIRRPHVVSARPRRSREEEHRWCAWGGRILDPGRPIILCLSAFSPRASHDATRRGTTSTGSAAGTASSTG